MTAALDKTGLEARTRILRDYIDKKLGSVTFDYCGHDRFTAASHLAALSNALDAKDKRIAELLAALERADEVIGPFAKEADQWDASVSDAYRPGVTEPGHSQAHANAEFSIGDLRAALAWKEKRDLNKEGLPCRS